MKYLILVMLMVSCKTGTTVELPVGTCYYEGGDLGRNTAEEPMV